MAESKLPRTFKPISGRFGSSSKEIKQHLLENVDKKNTKRATKTTVSTLNAYIGEKGFQKLESTPDCDLPDLLEDFYVGARTQKNELYTTQSLKSIRSGLNRHFKLHRKIDIITDNSRLLTKCLKEYRKMRRRVERECVDLNFDKR